MRETRERGRGRRVEGGGWVRTKDMDIGWGSGEGEPRNLHFPLSNIRFYIIGTAA